MNTVALLGVTFQLVEATLCRFHLGGKVVMGLGRAIGLRRTLQAELMLLLVAAFVAMPFFLELSNSFGVYRFRKNFKFLVNRAEFLVEVREQPEQAVCQ